MPLQAVKNDLTMTQHVLHITTLFCLTSLCRNRLSEPPLQLEAFLRLQRSSIKPSHPDYIEAKTILY